MKNGKREERNRSSEQSGSPIINSTRFSHNLLSSNPLSLFIVVRVWIAKASVIRLRIVFVSFSMIHDVPSPGCDHKRACARRQQRPPDDHCTCQLCVYSRVSRDSEQFHRHTLGHNRYKLGQATDAVRSLSCSRPAFARHAAKNLGFGLQDGAAIFAHKH